MTAMKAFLFIVLELEWVTVCFGVKKWKIDGSSAGTSHPKRPIERTGMNQQQRNKANFSRSHIEIVGSRRYRWIG
jgi:hypothetical protein